MESRVNIESRNINGIYSMQTHFRSDSELHYRKYIELNATLTLTPSTRAVVKHAHEKCTLH